MQTISKTDQNKKNIFHSFCNKTVCVIISCFFIACAVSKQILKNETLTCPEWITSGIHPDYPRSSFSVGTGEDMDPEMARRKAYREVADQLMIRIEDSDFVQTRDFIEVKEAASAAMKELEGEFKSEQRENNIEMHS